MDIYLQWIVAILLIGFVGKPTFEVISFPKSYNDGKCVYTKKRLFVGIYLFISQIIGMM